MIGCVQYGACSSEGRGNFAFSTYCFRNLWTQSTVQRLGKGSRRRWDLLSAPDSYSLGILQGTRSPGPPAELPNSQRSRSEFYSTCQNRFESVRGRMSCSSSALTGATPFLSVIWSYSGSVMAVLRLFASSSVPFGARVSCPGAVFLPAI